MDKFEVAFACRLALEFDFLLVDVHHALERVGVEPELAVPARVALVSLERHEEGFERLLVFFLAYFPVKPLVEEFLPEGDFQVVGVFGFFVAFLGALRHGVPFLGCFPPPREVQVTDVIHVALHCFENLEFGHTVLHRSVEREPRDVGVFLLCPSDDEWVFDFQ